MAPRIGIQLPEVEREVGWPEYLAIARAAEEVGFDSIWVGDHLLYRDPDRGPWEAWTLLAALAAATERVRLGPLVACTAFHPPGLIAKMAATLAEVSGGRFVLGLGAGWSRDEFEAFGLPYDHRVSRFEEAFTIIRRLLAGERVTLAGRYSSAEDAVLLPASAPTADDRQQRAAHAGHRAPARRRVEHLVRRLRQHAGGLRRAQRAHHAARREDAGRAPGDDRAQRVRVRACSTATAGERPITPDAPPIEGSPERIAAAMRELGEAGADEVILVVSPITERSVRELGEVVASLHGDG